MSGIGRRAGIDESPIETMLANRAVVAVPVADDDPALVGRRADSERSKRQRIQCPCHRAVGPPAALALAATTNGVGDRHSVPFDELDTFDELRVADEFGDGLGHHEARVVVGTELLDEERQSCRGAGEGRGCDVRRVRVAKVGEDPADLTMERVVRHQPRSLVQAAQLLHRIDAVHRPLQRKVHIQPVEEVREHRDDVRSLGLRQRIARRRGGDCFGPTQSGECIVHSRTASFAKS